VKFFASIEVEFEADDIETAHEAAEEYAAAIEAAFPEVIEAWAPNVEEHF
jgi:hypothetical protein